MADNPFEEKGAANPYAEPGARGGASGSDDFRNPFEQPAAPSPAGSVPAGGSAYESEPAPTSTFGAYDTGAYGASSGAYAAPSASAAPSAFNVRLRPTPFLWRRAPARHLEKYLTSSSVIVSRVHARAKFFHVFFFRTRRTGATDAFAPFHSPSLTSIADLNR